VRLLALTEEGAGVSRQMWADVTSRCPFMSLSSDDRIRLDRLLRESVGSL